MVNSVTQRRKTGDRDLAQAEVPRVGRDFGQPDFLIDAVPPVLVQNADGHSGVTDTEVVDELGAKRMRQTDG